MKDTDAYKAGVARAERDMEQGRRDLEAQAAEEALANEGQIPYEQKMNALRHNLRKERLAREALTGFANGRKINE